MKVSLNWVREYLDFELPAVDELVERIGAQLGAVEGVVDLGTKYQGATVVKVVECAKLEGSDHLNVCLVDDGRAVKDAERAKDGLVQVVCGAPNVRAGLLAVWLPPGTTVPSTADHEPLVLDARQIRGVVSNGMLASAKELAISDNHDGILELSPHDGKPGDSFAKVYKLDDTIIDIENKMFTHRPDCFGQLGVAREIAGILGYQFKSPRWYLEPGAVAGGHSTAIKACGVDNQITKLVPRYMLAAIDNVSVEPSPVWLQTYLSRVGVRPINNIVDITNYMMLLTGQPLHAFDFDKLAKDGQARIIVRHPRQGEKLSLLDGKTIEPRAEAILICNQDGPLALGGVMGGNNSEINAGTKRVLIECANFDMYNIRRTAMEHGIFSDAVTRFTKGQSPWQCPAVLAESLKLATQICQGAQFIGKIVDNHQLATKPKPQKLADIKFINDRLGSHLSVSDARRLLGNVEFEFPSVAGKGLLIKAPFWRTDIEGLEDLVEEVGRLYGYDKLPLELPRRGILPPVKDPLLELKDKVRRELAAAGANEVLTYSFINGQLLKKASQDPSAAYQLSNALSPDLQYYRLSLTPSLLDKVHMNVKAGYDQFVLFEIGKGHNLQQTNDDGLPVEFEMLDVVFAATAKAGLPGAAFYHARAYLMALAQALGLELEFRPFTAEETYQVIKPYDYKRSAQVFAKASGLPLGAIGEYKPAVAKNFKLPKHCAGFGLGLSQLLQATAKAANPYHELPRYPKVEQDICFKVTADLPYADLARLVTDKLLELKGEAQLTISPLDIFQREDDTDHKQITFRVSLASYQKTMRDAELGAMLDQLAAAATEKFQAERV